jgi:hypothetical protein
MSSTVARAASSGRCASVDVEAEIQLPDGSVYPPGKLTLCDSRAYSPVSSLHRTFVDGMPVGMLMSRRKTSEGDGDSVPEVMFLRDAHGRLQLFGYALPTGGGKVTFLLAGNTGARRPEGGAVAGKLPPEVSGSLVLVAARTH